MSRELTINQKAEVLWHDAGAESGQVYLDFMRAARNFDPAAKGDWQRDYVEQLESVVGALASRRVLDIGSAMGAQLSAMIDAGADAWGVERLPRMVQQTPFQNVQGRLLLMEAFDLSLLADAQFDLIHTSQFFEHIEEHQVPTIFAQMWRVTRPGGLSLNSICTGVDLDPHGDPTHRTIKPINWWRRQAEAAGWRNAPRLTVAWAKTPMAANYAWSLLCLEKAE